MTVRKGLKNNEAPGGNIVVNEFLKYDGYEVRDKLLEIMSMIFEKGEYLVILGGKIAKAQCGFLQSKNVLKNRNISLRTKIRILEATVMTMGQIRKRSEKWRKICLIFSREIAHGLFLVPY